MNSFLEKKFKKRTNYTLKESIELALDALQQSLGIDMKAEEVEVITVSNDKQTVTQLTNEEVESAFNAIAERD